MNYRARMRALREDRDLKQKDVARVINKSQQGYSHIEEGRAELKIDDLIRLCDFYGVSSDFMIGRSETEEKEKTKKNKKNKKNIEKG